MESIRCAGIGGPSGSKPPGGARRPSSAITTVSKPAPASASGCSVRTTPPGGFCTGNSSERVEESQVFNYLKATGLKVGLLLNFGNPSLEFQRYVWSDHWNPSLRAK